MLKIFIANDRAVEEIVPHLRVADVEELRAAGLTDLVRELKEGVRGSVESYVAVVDREPVAIFGLTHIEGANFYSPWMVGTSYIDTHPLQALRSAKRMVDHWKLRGPLVNYVHTKHEASKRWLAVLGFEVAEETIEVATGEKFHRFSMGVTYV